MNVTLALTGITPDDRQTARSCLHTGIGRWGTRTGPVYTTLVATADAFGSADDHVDIDVSELTAAHRGSAAAVLRSIVQLPHNAGERRGRQGGPPGAAVGHLQAFATALEGIDQ